MRMQEREHNGDAHELQLPAPTAWPMVLALGIALLLTSMVTNPAVGVLGFILLLMGAVGWFRQVLPHEAHETVNIAAEGIHIVSTRTMRERMPTDEMHRKVLPVKTFTLMSGVRGGIAGGAAMTIPAALYGLLKYHSIWYAMNLLAAGGFVSWAGASNAFLSEFHLRGLLAALAIHAVVSVLVGLLYGAVLPMFPRLPILSAGIIVPLFFTGLLYSAIGIISPILNERIDWFWFVVSQIAFGLVCGYVVNLHEKIRTPQFRGMPFALRAGIHSDKRERKSEGNSK
jgi:hypothetical protein